MNYNNLIHHSHVEQTDIKTVQIPSPELFEGPKHRDSVLIGARAVKTLIESQHEARTDHLTGLPNKRAFDEGLEQIVSEVQDLDDPHLALVNFDLDNFKLVNDDKEKGGHEAGNKVLETVAQILLSRLGTRDGEMVARTGGDEFGAVLRTKKAGNNRRTDKSEDEVLRGFAKRIEKDVEKLAKDIGMDSLGVSIGIVKYIKGETIDEFRDRADKAMYQMKEKRKSLKIV